MTEGEHTILIKDEDAAGNVGQTAALLFIVDNIPPTLTVLQPLAGATLTGNATVKAITSEDARNLSFALQNSSHIFRIFNDTVSSDGWNFTFSTTNFADAEGYRLNVTAIDTAGRPFQTQMVDDLKIDNTVPAVTLISPVDGGNYTGTIFLNATSSTDTIRVSFEYSPNNGASWFAIGTDFSNISGWSLDWNVRELPTGSYTVKATALDSTGLQANDTNQLPFTIDNIGGVITLTNPTTGTVINGTVNVTFTGGVRKPQLRIDGGALVNADTNSSYLWDTTTVLDGAHTLQVNDSDAQGNAIISPVYAFTVDNTPGYVTIIQPTADLVFIAGSVTVEALASDDVKYVVFNISNSTAANKTVSGLEGVSNDTTPADGWKQTLLTNAFADGDYNVTVRAYNVNNSLVDLDVRSVRFDNLAPTAPLLTTLPAFDTDGIVVLNWSNVGGDVSYYNLYRSTTSGFNISLGTRVKNVSTNLTTDSPGVDLTYYFKVAAVDASGHEGAESNQVSTTLAAGVQIFGTITANDTVVNDGSSILFTFAGNKLRLNVTINDTHMRTLDNYSGTLFINDSGLNGDLLSDDATYSAIYSINKSNNVSDGVKQLTAIVNDSAGNKFLTSINITLDNTVPNASIIINNGDAGTTVRAVSLKVIINDTSSEVMDCRFANEDKAFTPFAACSAGTSVQQWQLSSGNGSKTVVIQVRDAAGNINETNDTIQLFAGEATMIITPVAGDVIKGGKAVNILAPASAVNVTYQIINATNSSHVWSLAGTANGLTLDNNPSDGWSQVWVTTAAGFASDWLFNLTVISYDANGIQISNDTEGNIQVDNTAPTPSVIYPTSGNVSGVVTVAVSSDVDTQRVVFEYSSDGFGWLTLGTDFTSVGGWNITFDSRDYADTLTGRIRVNATDDAGLSANVSGGLFEIDNVGGVITLTNPTPGTVINGTVNVTFTGSQLQGSLQGMLPLRPLQVRTQSMSCLT